MATKDEVLKLLEQSSDNYLSGEEIAAKLDCSRALVWKSVKSLIKDGYIIQGVTKKGYKLLKSDILNQEILQGLIDIPVYFYKEIDSTNTQAKRIINNGVNPPFVVVSELQSGGRGRRGRSFSSEKGGTYISIVLNIPKEISVESITTRSCLGVSRVIDSLGLKSKIKWVNDIYLDNKKCVGILTEGVFNFEESSIKEIIIGIGVNFALSTFPPELEDIVTSLYKENENPISRAEFIKREIDEILKSLEDPNYLKEYKEKCFIIGKEINVIKANSTKEAKAIDLDDNAHLVVQYQDGVIEHLSCGEVSIRC